MNIQLVDDQLPTEDFRFKVDEPASLRLEIEQLVNSITEELHGLAISWVKLGVALNTVQQKDYWKQWGFESWGGYLDSISSRLDKKRSQIYDYIGVVKTLLPVAGQEKLVEIGVTKAKELKRIYKLFDRTPPPEIIEAAASPATTVTKLQKLVYENLNQTEPEREKYSYSSIAYRLPVGEQEVLDRAFDVALKTDPPVQPNTPIEISNGEALWRLSAYYLAGKEQEVLGHELGGEG